MSKAMIKQTMVQGALILTLASLLIRILGAIYRVPLGRLLGDEGLGIFAIPNQFYLLFYTITAAGIPVGVARLVSEKIAQGRYLDAQRAFRVTTAAMVAAGLTFTLLLFFGAGWLVNVGIVANPESYTGLLAVAPVILFAAISASYKGFFQGIRNMTAVAVSQVGEQIVLVTATLIFCYIMLPGGLAKAAAGANLGALPGAVVALLIMLLLYQRQKAQWLDLVKQDNTGHCEGYWSLLKKVFATSLPIAFASMSLALTGVIDNILIIDRLQLAGYTQSQATALYGQLNQMALSFINIGIVFAFSISTSMVPSVAEAYASGKLADVRNQTAHAVRLGLMTVMPAAVGLVVLAPQLMLFVFANEEAGTPLAYIAPAIVFWGVNLVLSGALQGLGRSDIPVKSLLLGLALRIAFTYYYTPSSLGIKAAAISTVMMFVATSFLNLMALKKLVGFKLELSSVVFRPALATGIMGLGVWETYRIALYLTGNNSPATALAILSGLVAYPLALVIVGGIKAEDAKKIPRVGRFLEPAVIKFEQFKSRLTGKHTGR